MAEGIVYLDVDDEITSAAQRIRAATGTKVAIVVPYGSRIATSRMNFRLLSREAVMNNRRLSIVSGDAAARSLAASAGLPVFGSVAEYESTVAGPSGAVAAPDGGADAGGVGSSPNSGGAGAGPGVAGASAAAAGASAAAAAEAGALAASETVVVAPVGDAAIPARKSRRPRRPVGDETLGLVGEPTAGAAAPIPAHPVADRPRAASDEDGAADLPPLLGRRIRAPVVAAIGLVVLALVVAGVGAYVFLPSASITLTPRREAIAPFEITVSADPDAIDVDPVNAVVPAVRLEVPVEAARTFTTTGTHVEETAARGSVTFTNYDFTGSGAKAIPAGSVVSTEGGTKFQTTSSVFLGAATRVGATIVPTQKSVEIRAAKTGTQGNVPANAIRIVPPGQDPSSLSVNNAADTTGGTHTETPEIKQAEVDKAVAALQVEIQKAFTDAVAEGAGAPPETTLFPETAVPGTATAEPDPKSLVGQAVETFDLRLTATGTVIAVDPRPVQSIARTQLAARIAPDHRLIEDSVVIAVGDGTVGEDGEVTFQASVRASQVMVVDATALPALVKGRTAAEAQAALTPFGTAAVTLWPDWVTTVTAIDARLSITVDDASAGAAPGASPGPGSSSPRPSRTPTGSGGPSGSRAPAPSGAPAASAAAP